MKIYVKGRNSSGATNPTKGVFGSILGNSNKYGNDSLRCINLLKLTHTSIYIALLLLLNMVLLVQIYKCYDRYVKGPTYVETKIVPQQKALFPSITFCAVRGGYKADVLLKHGYSSIRYYYWGKSRIIHWTSNDSTVDPEMLYQMATYNFTEMVKKLEIHVLRPDNNEKKLNIMDLDNITESVVEQRVRHLGRCYTYAPKPSIRKLGVDHVSIQFNIDVKIYFHGPDQYSDSSGRMGYKLYRGETMQSQIRISDIELLEREIVTKTEEDSDTGLESQLPSNEREERGHNKTCSNEPFDECLFSKLIKDMKANTEDNCTVPFITGSDKEKICTKYSDVNTTFFIRHYRITNQQMDCNTPCRTVSATLGAKNYLKHTIEKQDYARLDLYFSPRATVTKEYYLYTFLIFFSEVGGYVSLILGYSFFELFRWICRVIEIKEKQIRRTGKCVNAK